MRFLVLSDIHANLTALETALAAAEGRWEKAVCLGDAVGYGPDPNEVVDRIRAIGAVTIRGNHDKAGCGIDNADDFNPVARSAAMWTQQQLRPDNTEYLKQLPTGPLQVDGITIVHGAVAMKMNMCSRPHKPWKDCSNRLPPLLFSDTPIFKADFRCAPTGWRRCTSNRLRGRISRR
jgi:hypothetical protein